MIAVVIYLWNKFTMGIARKMADPLRNLGCSLLWPALFEVRPATAFYGQSKDTEMTITTDGISTV